MDELTRGEILLVVNRYIGVLSGYLGDFTYRTHVEFYPEFCGIDDIDPSANEGTTRERFIKILEESDPSTQAKILRGVLKKYPQGSSELRTQDRHNKIAKIIARLEGTSPVSSLRPEITSEVVERAISDAETLVHNAGATSGVDRIHTALHGYLEAVCQRAEITFPKDAPLTQLFGLLRQHHPAMKHIESRPEEVTKILRAISTILDVLNTLRNKASVAHPNQELLKEAEAMLVINSARTILHYLNAKVSPQ